jgi:hypothetical protein
MKKIIEIYADSFLNNKKTFFIILFEPKYTYCFENYVCLEYSKQKMFYLTFDQYYNLYL